MIKILTAVVLTLAIPAVAQAQAKASCCEKMEKPCCKKVDKDCCKDMDHSKMDHSKMGHDMKEMPAGSAPAIDHSKHQ